MSTQRKRRGGAVMEMALLAPWFVFLFIGAFDWGFYAYSLISVETAARAAAGSIAATEDATQITAANACRAVLPELSSVTNIGTAVTTCNAAPLVVTVSQINSVDGQTAVEVDLTYTTPRLIPIPGLLSGQFTITRVVKMRVV